MMWGNILIPLHGTISSALCSHIPPGQALFCAELGNGMFGDDMMISLLNTWKSMQLLQLGTGCLDECEWAVEGRKNPFSFSMFS